MPKNVDILFSFDPENGEARQAPHAGLSAKLIIPDPELIGKKATFTIKRHVQVKDSRPVHDTEEMFKHKFTVRGGKVTVPIPHDVLKDHPFQYDGNEIEIQCFGELVINDKLIRKDTSVQKDLPVEALKKPEVLSNTDELIDPKDIFSFSKNLMAIPSHNKIATLGLLIVGLVVIVVNMLIGVHDQFSPEHATYIYSHVDSDGDGASPLVNALMGCGAIGAAIWFAIRRQLRKYMKFELKPISKSVTRQSEHAGSDLFYGVSRTDLKDVTLRIVACNMEKGEYVRGSGSNRRTVSFSTPVRGILLYSKKVTLIPKNHSVENHFRDSMSFEPMFKVLYPPSEVSKSHGLFIYWEIQLIHNDFVDQELVGDTARFRREDFFTA